MIFSRVAGKYKSSVGMGELPSFLPFQALQTEVMVPCSAAIRSEDAGSQGDVCTPGF